MRSALLFALALVLLPLEQARPDDDEPPDPRIPVVDPDPAPEESDPNSPLARAFTLVGGADEKAGDRIALEVVLQVGTRVLPMKILTMTLVPKVAENLTVQLPEVRMTGISEKLEVAPDTWVLACSPRAPFEADFAAALIHVQRGPALSRVEDVPKPR